MATMTFKFSQYPQELEEISRMLSDSPIEGDGVMQYDTHPRLFLSMDGSKRLQVLIDDLYEEKQYKKKVSRNFISNTFDRWITQRKNNASFSSMEIQFQKLQDEYREMSQKQIIISPVFGLKLELDSFTIGDVKLIKYSNSQFYEQWAETFENEKRIENPEIFPKISHDTVCLEYSDVLEVERAMEIAQQEFETALNILRYTVSRNEFLNKHIFFDLFSGEDRRKYKRFMAVTENGEQSREHGRYDGPDEPLILDAMWLKSANAEGLNELSRIVSAPMLNKIEEMILRSVYWFGNYQSQKNLDNQLMSLAFSIESGMATSPGDNITTMLSEGIAILLGKDKEERIMIRDDFKKLYDLRSKISHGSKTLLGINDISKMDDYARRLVKRLLELSSMYSTSDELRKHVNDAKLSAP